MVAASPDPSKPTTQWQFSLRSLFVVMLLVALLCWAVVDLLHERQVVQYMPMQDAIRVFNASASEDPVGRFEPRLTEQEVITAIKRQLQMLAARNERAHAIYERIVETRTIPRSANLRSINGYTRGGVTKPVWWINLNVKTYPDAGLGFGLRVRENIAPVAADDVTKAAVH